MADARTPRTPKTRAKATAERDWKPDFLAALEQEGLVNVACKAAGIARSTAYLHREQDEAFAAAWQEVEDAVTDELELEARRRAKEGVESHKYDKDGNLLWTETKYSDTLLIFLLKARRPHVYRDNVKVEHTGAGGGPVKHELDIGSAAVRKHIGEALAASLDDDAR